MVDRDIISELELYASFNKEKNMGQTAEEVTPPQPTGESIYTVKYLWVKISLYFFTNVFLDIWITLR